MLIMFIPIVIFVLVLEYRRLMLTDPEPYIANGTFHLAHTSCGPVQGYPINVFLLKLPITTSYFIQDGA